MLVILSADEPELISAARKLVRAHMFAGSTQHSREEIESVVRRLPDPYVAPTGSLWVAMLDETALGCVALQEIAPGVSEMKRMYVRPEARGEGVGRQLTNHAIAYARLRGDEFMRLGTLSTALAAQHLYGSLGFQRIAPYRPLEFGETWFYELRLREAMRPVPALT